MAIEAGRRDRFGRPNAERSWPIAEERIRVIARSIPPPVDSFLLTSETDADVIVSHHLPTLTDTIQLVDALQEGGHESLRLVLTDVRLVQVVHIRGPKSVEEAFLLSSRMDALLLDSGDSKAAVKEWGVPVGTTTGD